LEFSRRQGDQPFDEHAVEVPAAHILGSHLLAPFVFPHYRAPAAYRQKIHALATRRHAQARDVFDMRLLAPFATAARIAPPDLIRRALEQLSSITFAMFQDQVVPFLPPSIAAHYSTPAAWSEMREQVHNDLSLALAAFQS
jgi:hypothetical protein